MFLMAHNPEVNIIFFQNVPIQKNYNLNIDNDGNSYCLR